MTGHSQDIFNIVEGSRRNTERPGNIHTEIAFFMDLNRHRINRSVYNFLDFLGDIGGLKEAVIILLSCVVFVFEVNSLENFIVSDLMKEKVKG